MGRRRWSTLAVAVTLVAAACAPVPRATTDLALRHELDAGTQPVLRVIVRTEPNQQPWRVSPASLRI